MLPLKLYSVILFLISSFHFAVSSVESKCDKAIGENDEHVPFFDKYPHLLEETKEETIQKLKKEFQIILKANAETNNRNDGIQEPEITDVNYLDEIQESSSKLNHPDPPPKFLYPRSPLHTMYLASLDQDIYAGLLKYSKVLEKRLELVNGYLTDFEENSLFAAYPAIIPNHETNLFYEDEWNLAYKVSSHPITALQLFKRLSTKLPNVLKSIGAGDESEIVDQIFEAKSSLSWPTVEDVEETKDKLLGLHQTYDLELEKFTNGEVDVINNTVPPVRPSVTYELCHELALHAVQHGKFASALEWMSLAMAKVEQKNPNFASIQHDYNNIAQIHDIQLRDKLVSEIFESENSAWKNDLFTQESQKLTSFKGSKVKDLYLKKKKQNGNNLFDVPTELIENQLCSGESWQHPSIQQTLNCFHLTNNHPYLLLKPYKIEILNHHPQILLIHDLFTPALGLDLVEHNMNGILDDPKHRDYVTPPEIEVDVDQIIDFTSLRVNFEILKKFHSQRGNEKVEEKFVMQFWSFGFNQEENREEADGVDAGDDFAEQETFIIHLYFRDVEAGGYTIFPDLGLSIPPTTGSALVFQTYKFTGFNNSPFFDLVWKNCPVISGIKWVGTKYYRQFGDNLQFEPIYNNWGME